MSARALYLIDTNHLGAAVAPGSPVRRRLIDHRRKGARIGTCVPVLCELEAGIQQVRDTERFRVHLEQILAQIAIWPIDRATARLYGEIYNDLRHRGRVLSQVDMLLASLSRQMDLTLVTTDSDFAALPDLRREDWTQA